MSVRIQKEDFDVSSEIAALTRAHPEIGAVVSFVGLVRGKVSHDHLKSMTLEHYPGMTEKELERLEKKVIERWKLETTLIIHRFGELFPGEQIVLVVTASRHRNEAFEANAFLIDFLKTHAPFWKKETFIDGTSKWVSAKEEDDMALNRWKA